MMKNNQGSRRTLTSEEADQLLGILKRRFDANQGRHPDLRWAKVLERLQAHPEKLWSLSEMERTGGEPDVLGLGSAGEVLFFDCSEESPKGRRSLCYDGNALDARKEHKPEGSACDLASEMGVEILTEEQYRLLQTIEPFDTKTSSWLQTPERIRKLGGAVFGDRRYDTVFLYHNGASSYYASRGFRACLRI